VLPSDITIRQAKPIDFPEIAEMHYPVWQQSWVGLLPTFLLNVLGSPKSWVAKAYPQSLSPEGWSMWIAEAGGRPLGMTIFGPDPADPDQLQIDALYIAQQSQRHGIGRRLLEQALSLHPSGDAVLWCAERNVAGRRFYEKRNFHLDGRTLDWEPAPGIIVPHVGYRLRRP